MTKERLMKEEGLNLNQALVVVDNSKELIVPAGAGSGKTKTLITKVLTLLKAGEDLDQFLVLTFTKKAATEMKDRLKKELTNEKMFDLVNKIDSSNISTFDAFAYNFVKQHATLINLDSSIELIDESIFKTIKVNILDNILLDIMNKKYGKELYNFLETFTNRTSEDRLIKDLINVSNSLNDFNLDEINVEKLIIQSNIFNTKNIINEIKQLSYDFYNEYIEFFDNLNSYFNYLEGTINEMPSFSYPKRISWKKLEIDDTTKKNINNLLKDIKNLTKEKPTVEQLKSYYNKEIYYLNLLIKILKIYEEEVYKFKKETNKYDFNDIANFLNKILKKNPNILKRQKEKFKYIFVDEYQDTSKVQDEFLEMLIKDNNNIHALYVGDIKQSIYKFRDAIPDIFLEKQNTVKNISLDINYRSSKKIIDFVNKIFTNILNDEEKYDINYKLGHFMESGSKNYLNDPYSDVYLLETYKDEDDRKDTDSVEEAFVVGNKIKELKEKNIINKYSEVAILARNRSSFQIYKDVFKYLNIPVQFQVDKNLKQTYLLKLISNILKLSLLINDNTKEAFNDKRFYYMSILRSELYRKSDYNIFNDLIDINTGKKKLDIEEELLIKLRTLNSIIKTKSNYEIIDFVIKEFELYKHIYITKSFEYKELQIKYLYDISKTLSDINIYSIDFVNYIYNLSYDDNIDLNVSILEDSLENSVKITNIHQSKGLEYEVLFLVGLNKKFNAARVDRFSFEKSSKFNINIKNHIEDELSPLADFINNKRREITLNDNLKEELRLLYVAITRAERALYIVTRLKDDYSKLDCFTDYLYENGLLDLIKNENIKIYNSYMKTDDYYLSLSEDLTYYPKLIDNLNDINLKQKDSLIKDFKPSTDIYNLLTEKEKENILKGNYMHLDFEFNNKENEYVNKLYNTKFNNKYIKDGEVLLEYEFIYEDNNKLINGIIDMLVIYDDLIQIIDYKLKDINKESYVNQLKSYEKYIKKVFNKKVELFLYSIYDNKYKQIK